MRTHPVICTLSLALIGCTEPVEPADPTEALLDFAEVLSADVYNALWDGIEAEEGVELFVPESGTSLSGQLSLPLDDGSSFGLDGELTADWSVVYEEIGDPDDYVNHWDWDFELEIARLAAPCCEMAGQGSWTVEHELYDYSWRKQVFDGQLSIDGGELQDVSFEAHYSGNLHWVRGSIGGTEVDWENPDADSC